MSLVDDLEKLEQLKDSGALTNSEFLLAKKQLLHDAPAEVPSHESNQEPIADTVSDLVDENGSLGEAANRYVTYKYKAQIIGLIVFVIVVIVFAIIFLSVKDSMTNQFNNNFPHVGP
jgi:t-SNARE complex subunit (syntaxin)